MESIAVLNGVSFENSTPAVRPDTLVRQFGNEMVVWSAIAPSPVYLDAVAAVGFQLFDGDASIAELIADVHEVLSIPKGVARNQLRRAVALLDEGGVLTSSSAPAPPEIELDFFPAPPNP